MSFRTIGRVLLALLLLGLGAWATLALRFAGSDAGSARLVLSAALGVVTIACVGALAAGWRPGTAGLLLTAPALAVAAWFAALEPRADRPWLTDVARAPWAEIDGNRITVHEVRDFVWRTEADYVPRWETRTVDLDRLEGVDLIASYWMGEAIAHVLVSFVFADAPPLAVSIETRKEAGEPYSTLLGFFRRYELVYVAADERDLIGVRTNVRADPPEDVYLYRVAMPKDAARRLFLAYLQDMNDLRDHPRFYNTAATNCTTMVLINNRVNGPVSLLNWKILLSGYLPQLVYERGRLDRSLPFAELRARSKINDAARAAGLDAPDFSTRIREGLPRPVR